MLAKTMEFLNRIGIPTAEVPECSGFLPNIQIRDGTIEMAPGVLVSDLLHEAGHLATIPGILRPLISGDIYKSLRAAISKIDPAVTIGDNAFCRAIINCGDAEATAWAWAAGSKIGLPPTQIICDADYGGTGSEIRRCLEANAYLGINGLAHAGFCSPRMQIRPHSPPVYPALAFWTQEPDWPSKQGSA